MFIADTPIASTQQAGTGDAVIFKRSTNLSPIDMINSAAKEKQASAASAKQEKLKLAFGAKKDFYKNLQDLNGKIWYKDSAEYLDHIDKGILAKVRDYELKGIDPFSDNNAMADINTEIAKLEALASASKSAEVNYNQLQKTVAAKPGEYDLAASYAAAEDYAQPGILQRAPKNIQPVLVPLRFGEILDKYLGDNVRSQLKIAKEYTDIGEVAKANEVIQKMKEETLKTAMSIGNPYVEQGRMNPTQLVDFADKFIGQWQGEAFYNPNKDEDQAIIKARDANTAADRLRRYNLNADKFRYAKSMSEIKDTEVDDLFRAIADGLPVNTSSLAGQYVVDGSGNTVKTGAFTPNKNAKGQVVSITYDTYTFDPATGQPTSTTPTGKITTPLVDSKNNYIFSTSPIYQSKFASAGKMKTPATSYTTDENGNYVEVPNPGATPGKKVNNTSTTISTSTVSKNKLTKTLSSGRVVYSDDNGKTWHP